MENIVTIVVGAVGILAGLGIAHFYYMKSRPTRTSVLALAQAIRKAPQAKHPERVAMVWILEAIEAHQKGEIYTPELALFTHMMNDISGQLQQSFDSATEAAQAAGMTLTPPYIAEYERALRDGLAALKKDIHSKLSSTSGA